MSRARHWLLGKSYNVGFIEQFQEQFRSGLFSRPYLTRLLRAYPPGLFVGAVIPSDFYVHSQHSLFPEDYFYRKLVKERLPILQYEALSPYLNMYSMRSSATLAQRMAFDWYRNIHHKFMSEDDAFQSTMTTFEKPLKELVNKLKPFAGDAAAELTLKMPYNQSLLCRVHARRVEVSAAQYAKKVNSVVKLGMELRARGWNVPRLMSEMVSVDSSASMVDQLIFYLRLAIQDHAMNRTSAQQVKVRVGNSGSAEDERLVTVYPLQYKAIETLLTEPLRKEYRRYRLAARDRAGKPPLPLDETQAETQEKNELIASVQTDSLYNAADVLLCHFRENEPPFTESTLEQHRILRHVLVKHLRFKHEKAVNQHLIHRILEQERNADKTEEDSEENYGMLALSRGRLPKEFKGMCVDSQLTVMDIYRHIHEFKYEELKNIYAMPYARQTTYPGYHENVLRARLQEKKEEQFFQTSQLMAKREELLTAKQSVFKAAQEAKAKRIAAAEAARAAEAAAKAASRSDPGSTSTAQEGQQQTPPSQLATESKKDAAKKDAAVNDEDLNSLLELLSPKDKK